MRDSEIKTLFAKADEQVHVDETKDLLCND